MTRYKISNRWLAMRIALMRFGIANFLAVLIFLLGLMSSQYFIPRWNAQYLEQQKMLTYTRHKLQFSPKKLASRLSDNGERLTSFYHALEKRKNLEEDIKTLFLLAKNSGLILQQADYKYSFDENGKFHEYQIILPIHGTYKAIRAFCETALLHFPFASLDEITFKRDSISDALLTSRIRFTFYILEESSQDDKRGASSLKDIA